LSLQVLLLLLDRISFDRFRHVIDGFPFLPIGSRRHPLLLGTGPQQIRTTTLVRASTHDPFHIVVIGLVMDIVVVAIVVDIVIVATRWSHRRDRRTAVLSRRRRRRSIMTLEDATQVSRSILQTFR
jgi:hypothetical protein